MGSPNTSCKITRDWLDGKKRTVKHANIHVGVDAICSYGDHFPMVIKTDDPDVMLVNDNKYSVTTTTHQTGVRIALSEAGFKPTDEPIPEQRGRKHSGFVMWRRS
jgi:hypothetical protein